MSLYFPPFNENDANTAARWGAPAHYPRGSAGAFLGEDPWPGQMRVWGRFPVVASKVTYWIRWARWIGGSLGWFSERFEQADVAAGALGGRRRALLRELGRVPSGFRFEHINP